MDLLLFGIQGSGKGTQGKNLAQRYNLKTFETGRELRKLAKENSPLGQEIKKLTEAGLLVPDETVIEIIKNFMKNIKKDDSVLFDGIPRKKAQAIAFNSLLKELNREFLGISIEISKEEAIRRLGTRRLCSNCKEVYPSFYTENKCKKCGGELITRKDDNPESINQRLKMFEEETAPVIEEYAKNNKLFKINGEQNIAKVSEDIYKTLDSYYLKK